MATVLLPIRSRAGIGILLVGCLAVAGWVAPEGTLAGQPGVNATPTHRMIRITDSIYRAENPGTPGLHGTSWVFINDNDVLVTDSGGSPLNARSIIEGVKSVTDKPVRYLIDTHFHIDHAYGNSGLPPDVLVIGHNAIRKSLLGSDSEARKGSVVEMVREYFRARIAALEQEILLERDPLKEADLRRQVERTRADLEVYTGEFPLSPPAVTFRNGMSIWSGNKEFRLLWVGRGHTDGDVIIHVPSERAAATGDIVFRHGLGVQNDSYPNEQVSQIEKVTELELEILLPAHGAHVLGREAVSQVLTTAQAFLREEWAQVSALSRQGLTPEEALARLNLSAFESFYGRGADPFSGGLGGPNIFMVRRIYDILEGRVR
jgi:cyclase